MTGVIVIEGIKNKVKVFLYFFAISKVIKKSPALQTTAVEIIFKINIVLSLYGSRGK